MAGWFGLSARFSAIGNQSVQIRVFVSLRINNGKIFASEIFLEFTSSVLFVSCLPTRLTSKWRAGFLDCFLEFKRTKNLKGVKTDRIVRVWSASSESVQCPLVML